MIHRAMRSAAVLAILAGAAWAQEGPGKTEPAPAPPPADEAKAYLKTALEASSAAGGFVFSGSVDQEAPMGGLKMFRSGPGGKFKGTVAANGTLHVKFEPERGSYEIFKKGSKIVQRQTWTGPQVQTGTFPQEVASIVSLARLLKRADRAKDVKVIEGRKAGDTPVKTVTCTFSEELIAEGEDDAEEVMGMSLKMTELARVEATLQFAVDGHALKSAEFKLVRRLGAMIRMGMGGGDDEEDEEGDEEGEGPIPGMKKTFSTTYKLELGGFDKAAAVELPEDVRKLLAD